MCHIKGKNFKSLLLCTRFQGTLAKNMKKFTCHWHLRRQMIPLYLLVNSPIIPIFLSHINAGLHWTSHQDPLSPSCGPVVPAVRKFVHKTHMYDNLFAWFFCPQNLHASPVKVSYPNLPCADILTSPVSDVNTAWLKGWAFWWGREMNILVEQSVISMEVVTSNSAGSLDKILIFDLQGTRGEQACIKLTTMIRSAKREKSVTFQNEQLTVDQFL